MSATTQQYADVPAEHLHELAHVERLLRADDRATEPVVTVTGNACRISWDSWSLNEHARGSLTASAAAQIAHTDAWGLSTIHDPFEHGDAVESMLTVVYDPDD